MIDDQIEINADIEKRLTKLEATVSKSNFSEGLSALMKELEEASELWGNSRNGKNTYSNGQNDGRSLAYADASLRIKLLMKTSR